MSAACGDDGVAARAVERPGIRNPASNVSSTSADRTLPLRVADSVTDSWFEIVESDPTKRIVAVRKGTHRDCLAASESVDVGQVDLLPLIGAMEQDASMNENDNPISRA